MKVEIFDAKSEEWQKVCAPVQRGIVVKRGGIVVVIMAKKDKEARNLSDFAREARKLCKMPLFGIECENIYDIYSKDSYKAYELVYHIYYADGSFEKCFKVAADLIELLGRKMNEHQTTTVVV